MASPCRSGRTTAGRCSSPSTPSSASIRAASRTATPITSQQNVAHTLINYEHCVRNPHGFKGYGPDCWGLSSSDDHLGYHGHAPDRDLGVITPTAALSSFPYTPEHSIARAQAFLPPPGRPHLGRVRLRRRVQRDARLVRELVPRDRPGPDRRDDRELPYGPALEPVHELPRDPAGPAPAGLPEPAPR